MPGVPPLGIWSTSIFLFWNISSSTGPYYATFPVIIRAKRTPISKIQMDHLSHSINGHEVGTAKRRKKLTICTQGCHQPFACKMSEEADAF